MADPNDPTIEADAGESAAEPSVVSSPAAEPVAPPAATETLIAEPVAPPTERAPVQDEPPLMVAPIGRQDTRSRARSRPAPPAPSNEPDGAGGFDAVFEGRSVDGLGDRLAPTTAYLLMILSPLTLGLLAVPAALIAWSARGAAPDWLRTHYLFQLRTFFTASVLACVAIITELFGQTSNAVGVVASAVWMLCFYICLAWFVLRATLGLARLRRGEPIRNWRTWLV